MALRYGAIHDGARCLHRRPAKLAVAKEGNKLVQARQHEGGGGRKRSQPLHCGGLGGGGILARGRQGCVDLCHDGRISRLHLGCRLLRLRLGVRLCALLLRLGGDGRALRVPCSLGLRFLDIRQGLDVRRVLLEFFQRGLELLLLGPVRLVLGSLGGIVDLHLVLANESLLLLQRCERDRWALRWLGLGCGCRGRGLGRGCGSLGRRRGSLGRRSGFWRTSRGLGSRLFEPRHRRAEGESHRARRSRSACRPCWE
mmetsp:Transcript_23977/g.74321  ORF Transcript_23977/g.74321 Transcript_23977/m.74321 type:complete len:255 (-) Transcript_23977:7-771(-)